MSEWRTMESAPEFEAVLLCLPRYGVGYDMPEMAVGERDGDAWYSDGSRNPEYKLHRPFAWMPLPAPPTR